MSRTTFPIIADHKYLVFICLSILFVISACKSNSSDSGETFESSEFIGEWERISSTSDEFVACPENPPLLEISQTEIRYPYADDEGCHQSVQILEYTFDGQKFSVDAGWNFEILSHTGSGFSWLDDFDGTEETYARAE
jgi:hypothetical protein